MQTHLIQISLFLFICQLASKVQAQTGPLAPLPYRKGNLYGYADAETGKVLLQPQFDSVGLFYPYNLTWVKKDGRYGLINRQFEIVLPIEELEPLLIDAPANDLLIISKSMMDMEPITSEDEGGEYTMQPIFSTLFHKDGARITKPFEFQMDSDFSIWLAKKGNKIAALNPHTGKLISSYEFDEVAVSTKFAFIYKMHLDTTNGRWDRVYDACSKLDFSTGKLSRLNHILGIDASYSYVLNRIPASNLQTKLTGYLDSMGNIPIPFNYLRTMPFDSNGLAFVYRQDSTWVQIDQTGKELFLIGKTSDMYPEMNNGNFWVREANLPAKILYGPDAHNPIFQDWLAVPNSVSLGSSIYWFGQKKGGAGAIDQSGNVVVPFEYRSLYPQTTQVLSCTTSGTAKIHWILANQGGEEILIDVPSFVVRKLPMGEKYKIMYPIIGDSIYVVRTPVNRQSLLNINNGNLLLYKANSIRITEYGFEPKRLELMRERDGRYFEQYFDANLKPYEDFGKLDLVWSTYSDTTKRFYAKFFETFDSKGYAIFNSSKQKFGFISAQDASSLRLQYFENQSGSEGLQKILVAHNSDSAWIYTQDFTLMSRFAIDPGLEKESEMGNFSTRAQIPRSRGVQAILQNRMIFRQNGKYGVYDLFAQKIHVPFVYEYLFFFKDKWLAIDSLHTCIEISPEGKQLRRYPVGYKPSTEFSSGYQYVYGKDCKSGLVDTNLQMANFGYSGYKSNFVDGLCIGVIRKSEFQFFRPDGSKALNGQIFSEAVPFKNNRAIVRPQGKAVFQLIDTSYHVYLESVFDSTSKEGFGAISWQGDFYKINKPKNKFDLFDREGKLVFENADCLFTDHLDSMVYVSRGDQHFVLEGQQIKKHVPLPKLDSYGEKFRYQESQFGCGSGIFDTLTQEWLIMPKANQEVYISRDFRPIARICQEERNNYTGNSKSTCEAYHLELHVRIQINSDQVIRPMPGLGWLIGSEKETFLYTNDLSQKREVAPQFMQAWFNEQLQAFEYQIDERKGYITKTGVLLEED